MPAKSSTPRRIPAEIRAFLSAYTKPVREIALQARALVLELEPDVIEQIDVPAKMLAYGYAATYKDTICVITPPKLYVNLGFPRGADLPDPAKLLTGTGKRARHIKLTDPNQANSDAVRALLRASIAQIEPH